MFDSHILEGGQEKTHASTMFQADHDLEKLVSLVKCSGDRTTLSALSAGLDAEIETLSRQVTTVRSNLGAKFQFMSHRRTLESGAGLTAAENPRMESLPAPGDKLVWQRAHYSTYAAQIEESPLRTPAGVITRPFRL